MRHRLAYIPPPTHRSVPAARIFQGVYDRSSIWSVGNNPRETCKTAGGAATVFQGYAHRMETQQNRSEVFIRTASLPTLQSMHAKIPSSPSHQVASQTSVTPVAAASTGFPLHFQFHASRSSFALFHGALPHFLADLQLQTRKDNAAEDFLTGTGKADGEVATATLSDAVSAYAGPELLPVISTGASADHGCPLVRGEAAQAGERRYDLLRLQSRYDALLRNPQAFSMQLQLLHACIQDAQDQHAKSVYMKQLQPLQQRIRTPGTDACLEVHPLLYAAFCMYNPSLIHIAAAKRVGAAEHFVEQYLKAKSRSRGYGRICVSKISRRGRGAAEQWLANISLCNICIYPLEALSPELRLFSLTAPQRLAAWEDIISRALAS